MLRINRLTDYGTLVLTYLASHPGQMRSANDVAIALGLGAPTVSKILKTLGRHELVHSNRGFRGGYSLSRAPETISVADIIDALEEQPFGLTECSASEGVCSFESNCRIRTSWQRINDIVRRTLEDVSLVDMMQVVPERGAAEKSGGGTRRETKTGVAGRPATVPAGASGARSSVSEPAPSGAVKGPADESQAAAGGQTEQRSGRPRAASAASPKTKTRPGKRAERARVAQP